MTEAQWLRSDDPVVMLALLRDKASDRGLRLLACAIIRSAPFTDEQSMWALVKTFNWFEQKAWRYELGTGEEVNQTEELLSVLCHEAVEIAEQCADAPGMEHRLATAAFATFAARYYEEADTFGYDPAVKPASGFRYRIAQCLEHTTVSSALLIEWMVPSLDGLDRPVSQNFLPTVASLIRDISGNPFRPIAFSPEWRTDTAVSLARTMYDPRDFSAMPILADALQDAGCDGADILDHCRRGGPHVRGCWVVDLVLGRS